MELNTIDTTITKEVRSDGSILMRSTVPLEPTAHRLTDFLADWAKVRADKIFFGATIPKNKSKRQVGSGDIFRCIRQSKKYFAGTPQ